VAHFAGSRKLAFAIRTSKIQGKGAFATRRIPKGQRIIEYLGECIDEAESDVRYPDDEMGRHHTFLFSIGDGERVLDAGPIEWPAKYINHSCDPNCEAIEEEDGRVFISALRAIAKGAELLYDYAYERTDEHTAADEALYVCRCGSPKCRGTIMAPPKLKKKDKKAKKKEKNRAKERDKKRTTSRDTNSDRKTDSPTGGKSTRKRERDAAKAGHAHAGEAHAAKKSRSKKASTSAPTTTRARTGTRVAR
jgi:uncharacterized protein